MSIRKSGIMLHPTSLPGPYGIGDLGEQAYRFVDFLAETEQSIWQILPLGHTSFGNSPYMCFSAFSGNPFLISPDELVREGLISKKDLEKSACSPKRVHYGDVIDFKMSMLNKAFQNWQVDDEFLAFVEEHDFWLEDYALFAAVKNEHGGKPWNQWERDIATYQPDAVKRWREKLNNKVRFWKFVQFIFFKQWKALKAYCHSKNIEIIGDIPIYVAYDSADVWANPHLFHLDAAGNPTVVSGVPPDYFSATGQRWGNPIYRWDVMAENNFEWWIQRFRLNMEMVDQVRLDHFRGFEAYWEIPAHEETAVNGTWVKGPGAALFNAVKRKLGDIDVIAEDLGVITPEVDDLRDTLGFPGMRILQVAFGTDDKSSEYQPHNYIQNCVVYTGSHDHNTTVGWFTAEPGSQTTQTAEQITAERKHVLEYLNSDGAEIHWDFIRLALGSVANTAIFPLQDVLGLDSSARMNLPGTAENNWEWRFDEKELTPAIRNRLKNLTRLYERSNIKE